MRDINKEIKKAYDNFKKEEELEIKVTDITEFKIKKPNEPVDIIDLSGKDTRTMGITNGKKVMNNFMMNLENGKFDKAYSLDRQKDSPFNPTAKNRKQVIKEFKKTMDYVKLLMDDKNKIKR